MLAFWCIYVESYFDTLFKTNSLRKWQCCLFLAAPPAPQGNGKSLAQWTQRISGNLIKSQWIPMNAKELQRIPQNPNSWHGGGGIHTDQTCPLGPWCELEFSFLQIEEEKQCNVCTVSYLFSSFRGWTKLDTKIVELSWQWTIWYPIVAKDRQHRIYR